MEILVITAASLFFFLAAKKIDLALALFFGLLPTYLIRFPIFGLPTTLLEVFFGILIVGFLKNKIASQIFFRRESRPRLGELLSGSWIKKIWSQFPSSQFLSLGIFFFLLGATISIFTSVNIWEALGEYRAFYLEPIVMFFILTQQLKTKPDLILEREARPNNSELLSGSREKIKSGDFNEQLAFKIIFCLILSGLAISIYSIFQHFTGYGVPHAFWANQNTFRVTAWYGFPNAVGMFLAPIFPLAIYLLMVKKPKPDLIFEYESRPSPAIGGTKLLSDSDEKIKFGGLNIQYLIFKIIPISFLILSPLAILFAKGSGAIIGLLAGLIFILLINRKTRLVTIITLLFVSGSLLFLNKTCQLVSLPTCQLVNEITAQNRSGQIRRAIWSETFQLLRERPILGAGLASYEERIAPYHQTVNNEKIEIFHHPHNLFLTIWVNTGIIGLIGFILIILLILTIGYYNIHNNYNIHNISKYLISALIIILTMGLVDSPYIKNDLAFMFWLLIAFSSHSKFNLTQN